MGSGHSHVGILCGSKCMVLQVVSICVSLEHPLFDNEDRPLLAVISVQFYISVLYRILYIRSHSVVLFAKGRLL